ncbi:MAG: hypothetical protein RMI91_13580 [Gemmatales bacterium]|nr:hypothetical protein [Gemmatales bacterium]
MSMQVAGRIGSSTARLAGKRNACEACPGQRRKSIASLNGGWPEYSTARLGA